MFMLLHPLRWARRTAAVLLCLAVGVLDQQAFRWVPFLQGLSSNGLGHALLLLATGLLAGLLFGSLWAIGIAPVFYLVGFEAARIVTSRSLAGLTDAQHLSGLFASSGWSALLVLLGAALVSIIWVGWIAWRRRRPRGRQGPPPSGNREVGAPTRSGAGQTTGR
jgi:hypothetical protein